MCTCFGTLEKDNCDDNTEGQQQMHGIVHGVDLDVDFDDYSSRRERKILGNLFAYSNKSFKKVACTIKHV
jgi:hypothetical protein